MILGLIPSRLKSTRLFEKPLLKIDGLPVIIHTMKRAMLSKKIDDLYVCTDSNKIAELVKKNGGKYIITSSKHKNGTERIAEGIKKISIKPSLVVDIQGDEPTISPKDIDKVISFHLKNLNYDIVVPHTLIENSFNHNRVKIISNREGNIVYMSRQNILNNNKKLKLKKHLSIISFKSSVLKKFKKLGQSYLEKIEGIELLRALENGYNLGTIKLNSKAHPIDVKKDIIQVKKFFKKDKYRKLY